MSSEGKGKLKSLFTAMGGKSNTKEEEEKKKKKKKKGNQHKEVKLIRKDEKGSKQTLTSSGGADLLRKSLQRSQMSMLEGSELAKSVKEVKMSNELLEEVSAWEAKKGKYLAKARRFLSAILVTRFFFFFFNQLQPLMQEKQKELEKLFEGYLSNLKQVSKEEGLETELQRRMVEAEAQRLRELKVLLFGKKNASLEVMDKEIESRKNILVLEERILLIQKVWRGYRVRRDYSTQLKHERQRNKLAQEILETERVYVRNLEKMVDTFIKPLRELTLTVDQILSSQEISIIFSNIELILGVNKTLLADLEERMANWSRTQRLGDVFLKLAPFLKLYIQYVNNYNMAITTTNHCMNSNSKFKDFLQKTLSDPEVVKMGQKGLPNFQILPVQRIPRYELLLRDVVKYTDEEHPDFKDLCEALFKVQDVAKKINESKRIAEDQGKVIEIQEKLGLDDLVQPFRRFIREGPIMKEAESRGTLRRALSTSFLPYFLFLFSDTILLAKRRKKIPIGEKEGLVFREKIELSNARIEPLGGGVFSLLEGKKQYKLVAETESEGERWIADIERVIAELQENKQTLRLEAEVPQTVERIDTQSMDTLISQLPAVPNLGVVSTQSASPGVKSAKLSQLLEIYSKVFELHNQLFQAPIYLESLIPQFTQQLSPHRVIQIYDRLEELKRKVEEMMEYKEDLEGILKYQKSVVQFATLLSDGQGHIAKLSQWVKETYSRNSVDPNAPKARAHASYLMQWYIELVSMWDLVTEEVHT